MNHKKRKAEGTEGIIKKNSTVINVTMYAKDPAKVSRVQNLWRKIQQVDEAEQNRFSYANAHFCTVTKLSYQY